jgi:hypothetical protein
MGIRKGINLGKLFRINLSRTGVGFSLGVKGFRIGRDATGRSFTHTSLPGTGIYRRDYGTRGPALSWQVILRRGWPVLVAILVIAVLYFNR